MSAQELLAGLVKRPAWTLRCIKNTLPGRELRKIEFIEAGLIPMLNDLLSKTSIENTDEKSNECVWKDAVSVVATLANSGTAFTQPILGSGLVVVFLRKVKQNPTNNLLVLAIWRCMSTIADNLPPQSTQEWQPDSRLVKELYRSENVELLVEAATLSATLDCKDNSLPRRVARAALGLICRTCTTQKQRIRLVRYGVLDVLAAHLQTIHTDLIGRYGDAQISTTYDYRSPTSSAWVALIFEAISLVVEDSKQAATAFIAHECLRHVFTDIPAIDGYSISVPTLPDPGNSIKRSNFPPLGYSGYITASTNRRSSSIMHDSSAMVVEDSDDESDAHSRDVTWILLVARLGQGRLRLMAARLLGILKNHGLLSTSRTRSFAALLVPLLVDMIDTRRVSESQRGQDTHAHLVPATLALLVRDSELLQDAAVECKAIPKLAVALKVNFETKQGLDLGLWWPNKLDHRLNQGEAGRSLGISGPSQSIRFDMQHREGLLQALAALAPTKDAHRKDICDQGALAQIILALEPLCATVNESNACDTISITGNSAEALIAACGAIRALTRSATALRTKLVDAEVAKSIVRLLQTAVPEVRIAATMVMANLAHDFSPMKSTIGERSIVRKLCEQAHSANARLRYESLFALKALVNNSVYNLKRQVVDELGPSWIRQLISTDPHDIPAGEVIGLVPNDYEKGSMVRVADDAPMQDIHTEEDEEPDLDAFDRHTLQDDLDIQAELLGFLRNLTTGEGRLEIIEYLLEHIGEADFLRILLDRLQIPSKRRLASRANSLTVPHDAVANTLYILCHLCSAHERYCARICQDGMLTKQIVSLLNSSAAIRCAACWLILNMIYPTTSHNFEGAAQRARELQRLGVVSQLRRIEMTDESADVKERVRTALECFGRLLDRN